MTEHWSSIDRRDILQLSAGRNGMIQGDLEKLVFRGHPSGIFHGKHSNLQEANSSVSRCPQ